MSKTVNKWRLLKKSCKKSPFPGKGDLIPEDKAYKEMVKKIKDLEEENIILKNGPDHLSCFAIHLVSRKGNCFDNACAESFFATLKKDEVKTDD